MSLLGGLALFLYGMQIMSTGLEAAAGTRMKSILERLTANRFIGVLVGSLITAVIQSSSATTVMVVGFVNSGMMTLSQSVWIIMGANIGTTITGQLIALDILNREISKYITAAASYERTKSGSRIYNALFSITGNIERISDHAMNIAEYSEILTDFERVGDHALNIAEEMLKISSR